MFGIIPYPDVLKLFSWDNHAGWEILYTLFHFSPWGSAATVFFFINYCTVGQLLLPVFAMVFVVHNMLSSKFVRFLYICSLVCVFFYVELVSCSVY